MTTSFPAAPLTRPVGAPPAFHLLAKPTGAICNLDCAYCFFLDKEVFYPGSKFRMSDDVLEQYIRQLIESHQTDSVNIAWQGGEPTLMGLDFYRRAMALVEKYRRPGMTFPAHHADQRHAAGRRVGGLLQGTRLPDRHQHRRAAPAARCLPRGQGRQADLRQGDARAAACFRSTASSSTPDHRQPGQRRLSAGGLPLPARRGRHRLDAVHPGGGAHQRGRPDALPGRDDGLRALGAAGAVRPFPERHLRRVGAPRCGHASSCRPSRRRCATGWAWPLPGCASSTRPAARGWPSSTTAICTRATTSSSRTTSWATSRSST